MKINVLKDANVEGKLILLRTDVNSPVVKGKLIDSPRFSEAAKTINYLLKKKAKVVILAHQGSKESPDFMPPLLQHARILSKYAKRKISYVDGLFEDRTIRKIKSLKNGEAILLKNVRHYKDEFNLKKSRFHAFSKIFDIYVNDAFSVSHRKHASIVIPPEKIISYAGLLFEKELDAIQRFASKKSQAAAYLLGGEKIKDYLPLFDVLKDKKNILLLSGVPANIVLISLGRNLGYENHWVKEKRYANLLPEYKERYLRYSRQIILPVDFAIGSPEKNISINSRKEALLSEAPYKEKIWDVGHKTSDLFKKKLEGKRLIFMKGPLGY